MVGGGTLPAPGRGAPPAPRPVQHLRNPTGGLERQTRGVDAKQDEWNTKQETWNENATIRFNRIEADMSSLKGDYARTRTIQDARGIAADLGLQYIRTLTVDDVHRMAGRSLERDVLRGFRNADLVIEAADGTDTRFIAMEISFAADQRDCNRAVRNAELITRFTGKLAQAAVASVRNDQAAATRDQCQDRERTTDGPPAT